jgi:NAD-reducing hydrogenase large subunit
MERQIVIEPLTRIEGHAKITLHLDGEDSVADARFHVTQVRGFERLCDGRPFYEMPSLMARICGICPVSHLIASAKACDMIMAVRIPEPAVRLRRLMNLAQIVQSHALSFFHLSSPDLLLGMDADPARRHLFGVLQADPVLARGGIRLRQFGQQVIAWLGGKRIHPAWVVAGGVSDPLSAEQREHILTAIPEAMAITQHTLAWFKQKLEGYREEIRAFANFPSYFLGLVTPEGGLEYYDGKLRVVDARGGIVADQLDPMRYADYVGEAVEPWTYLKFPYYKPVGYPEGMHRVGPLARLNIADRCGTVEADREWAEFRELQRGAVLSSFHYHYARLISRHVRASAGVNNLEGIGVAEAPRGTLIHHYKVDEQGLITWANLIIATGHNNLAMNRGVLQVARRFINGTSLTEGMLNRVEAVIRTFDPCLSCSTHALGQMPLHIQLVGPDGAVLDERRRD